MLVESKRWIALGDGVGLVDLNEARGHPVARSGRDRLADGMTGRRSSDEERVDLIVGDGAGEVLRLDL